METTLNKRLSWRLSKQAKRIVVEVICYLFIALFLYAAVNKLLDYEKFKAQMGQSAMLTPYVDILAWAVPGLEIVIVVFLFIPRTVSIGLYCAFTLMMLFTTYIGILLAAGGHLPCSCGGVLQKMSWGQHLIFNIGFALLGALGLIFQSKIERINTEHSGQDILLQ